MSVQKLNPASHSKAPSQEASASSIARTAVSLEYASLRYKGHCPLGMYVIPSAESLLVWDAVLFVHQGLYLHSSSGEPAEVELRRYCRILCRFNSEIPPHIPCELP